MQTYIYLEMPRQLTSQKEILVSEMDFKEENIGRYFRGVGIFN
jgi:hypothetical protein